MLFSESVICASLCRIMVSPSPRLFLVLLCSNQLPGTVHLAVELPEYSVSTLAGWDLERSVVSAKGSPGCRREWDHPENLPDRLLPFSKNNGQKGRGGSYGMTGFGDVWGICCH